MKRTVLNKPQIIARIANNLSKGIKPKNNISIIIKV